MDARSKPYFFAFDTKSKPGKILAHCIRFETMEIDPDGFEQAKFTLVHNDKKDKRTRQLITCIRQ